MKQVTWRLYVPAQTQFYSKLLFKKNLTGLERKIYDELFISVRRALTSYYNINIKEYETS